MALNQKHRLCNQPGVEYLPAMSTVTEIKTAFKRLPERDRSKLAEWIQQSVEEQDPELEAALRHSLRGPLKKNTSPATSPLWPRATATAPPPREGG